MNIYLKEWNGKSLEVSGWADSIIGAVLVTTGLPVKIEFLDKTCVEVIE